MSHPNVKRVSFGTCIVAVITPDEIIIGADSLRRYADGNATEVCKIRKVGNVVFANAGFIEGEHENLRFSVSETVSRAIQTEKNISDAMTRIETDAKIELTAYLDRLPTDEKIEVVYRLNGLSIEFVLCGIEGDFPVLSKTKLNLKSSYSKIEFDVEPPVNYFGDSINEPKPVRAGHYKSIENRTPKMTEDLVAFVRDSINIQVDHDRNLPPEKRWVGGPIRIVRVTRSGIMLEE